MSGLITSFLDMIEPKSSDTPAVRTVPVVRAPPVIGSTVGTTYTSYTQEDLRPRVVPTTSTVKEGELRYQVAGGPPIMASRLIAEAESNSVFDALDKNHDGVLTRDELRGRVIEPVTYVPRQGLTAAPVIETIPVVAEVEVPAVLSTAANQDVVTVLELQRRLDGLVASVNGSLQQALSQVIEATNTISAACEERFVAVEKDCAVRQLAMEALAKEVDTRQGDLWRSERTSVLSDVADLRNEVAAMRTKLSSEQRTQANFNETVDAMSRKIGQNDALYGSLRQEVEAIQRSLQADVQVMVDGLRRDMDRCKDPRVWADIETLRAQCEGLDAELNSVRRKPQVEEVQREVDNMGAQIQELHQKTNDMRREAIFDKTQAETSRSELSAGLGGLQTRVDQLQREMKRDLEVWAAAVEDRRREFEVLQADYQQRLTRDEKDIAELYASSTPLRAEMKRMVDEVAADVSRNTTYVNSNLQRLEASLRDIEELRRNVADLSTGYEQQGLKIQELEQMSSEVYALKRRMERLAANPPPSTDVRPSSPIYTSPGPLHYPVRDHAPHPDLDVEEPPPTIGYVPPPSNNMPPPSTGSVPPSSSSLLGRMLGR